MKARSAIIFLLVLALLAGGIFIALNGITIGDFKLASISDSMKLGLDIEGGVYVIMEANTDATGDELKDLMNRTKIVMSRRVNQLGLTEPNIILEGDKRIRVELPGVKNAQDAIEAIGKTAQLQFVKADGTVVVTGSDIKDAGLTFDSKTNEPQVSLEFKGDGREAFYQATKELAPLPSSVTDADGNVIANVEKMIFIVLDGQIVSQPMVNVEIPNGQASISGSFTSESAANLAAMIRAGALPVELMEVQTSTIGPTLGLESLNTSLKAAMLGIALVLIFMLIVYRVPGLVADIALLFYILIVVTLLVGLNATLTLPGVAGLILSVGMAVDANVIIFERLKEELKNGKTIRSAIDSGFSKALRTIVDSNITTFIAAIVLYYFGLGPIKGFAVTLMIGIISSMFTAVFVTKQLLKLVVGMDVFKDTKFFGA